MTEHRARVTWDADRDDLRAHTVRLNEQELAGSSQPAFGGDESKADPEQLLVASVSACHMLWFLDYSRRERLRVTSYEDEPEGTTDEKRFTRVVLRPRIEWSDGAPDDGKLDELHHRAHEACFIANSVNFPVEVEAR